MKFTTTKKKKPNEDKLFKWHVYNFKQEQLFSFNLMHTVQSLWQHYSFISFCTDDFKDKKNDMSKYLCHCYFFEKLKENGIPCIMFTIHSSVMLIHIM